MTTVTEAQWDAFARAHPDASFFHLSAWRHVAPRVFGHKAHFLSVERDGAIAAILPLVEVSHPLFGHSLISNAFCVGGGPLALDEAARIEILERAESLGRALGVDAIELRDTPEAAPGWLARDDLYAGFKRGIAADETENLNQIPRKQRAVIRKAVVNEYSVAIERHADNFFPLYAQTVRDHGTPAMPKRYFETLLEVFGDDCEILTISHGARPTASVLSFYFADAVLPYYTGSHKDARRFGSNDIMYWQVMRRAVERGFTAFDFGRSKVGTGPYSFKKNWGFEPRPITHQYRLVKANELPNLNPTNPKYALFIQAWRKLPLPLANALSPLLSRGLA